MIVGTLLCLHDLADHAVLMTPPTAAAPSGSPDTPVAERQVHLRTCPLCEATCGLEITTEGDQVVRIRGDQNDPVSKGFICPKGSTLKQLHADPDRLTSPMIRNGVGWREASWDEAFELVRERIGTIADEHGRQALSVVLGNPNVHNLGGMVYLRHVIKAAATTNVFSASTVDQMPKHVSAGLLWGDPDLFPLPDVGRTDYLLMLGANPYVSNGSLVTVPDFPGHLEALTERGGRLVVVDPRRTKTAEAASEHLEIRPGSDVWWLFSLINVLFDEDLVAIGRLEAHISGVEEVRAAVAPHTPESVATRCGIDAATTRRIARELAAAPRAAVYGRIGTHTVEFGTLASWAADVLNVLTGNLDEPGGVMFNGAPTVRYDERAPGGRGFQTGRWSGRASGAPEVKGELPAARLAEEIETPGEGQIRAMVLVACNPVRSFPNSDRLDAAFADLDFLVAVDPYITASSRHADVILPPPSALERSHYDLTFERAMLRSFAKYSPPVFALDGLDEPEILCRLATALAGLPTDTPATQLHDDMMATIVEREIADPQSPIHGRVAAEILEELGAWSWAEQMIDFRLRVGRFGDGFGADPSGLTLARLRDEHPHGIDHGPLESRFPSAIRTSSGTVELFPDPVAADLERLARSPMTDPDQLVLCGRRHLRSCNTWMHNVDVLVKGRDRCTLQVHPGDAERLGLVDQGQASVTSAVGTVTAPVEITDEVMAGVVSLPFGWGYDEPGIAMRVARSRPGVNSNRLTDDAVIDTLSGNAVLNAIPVDVAPA